MSKNIEIKNTSTELFYDLAKRSFEASWKTMQDMCSDSISHLVDDADFMSAFIRSRLIIFVITLTSLLHKKEIKEITEVNFEEVAERLVRNAWVFC
jgi:hypothetical protein